MVETKPLKFKAKDFYVPAIGIATASERNPVETREYSTKMYLQATLFSIFHAAYISGICFGITKGLETLLKLKKSTTIILKNRFLYLLKCQTNTY